MNNFTAASDEDFRVERLSHELKTPLAAIAAFAYLLEADEALAGCASRRARCTQLREAALQMLGIVVQTDRV